MSPQSLFLIAMVTAVGMIASVACSSDTPIPATGDTSNPDVPATVAVAVQSTIDAIATVPKNVESSGSTCPSPQIADFPFSWRESKSLTAGGEAEAAELTILDFLQEGESQTIPGYVVYKVSYTVEYLLWTKFFDIASDYPTIGVTLKVLTEQGHTYGGGRDNIDVHDLRYMHPGQVKQDKQTFHISPSDKPVQLQTLSTLPGYTTVCPRFTWNLDLSKPSSSGPTETPLPIIRDLPPWHTPTPIGWGFRVTKGS
jgi:hypothetical protein